MPQPSWLSSERNLSIEERLTELDDWLESCQASPWDLSGLPPLEELDGEFEESFEWMKSCRQKGFLKKKRQPPFSKASKSVREFLGANEFLSPEVSSSNERKSVSSCPNAKQLGVKALSPEAISFLSSLPREQFIFPASWNVQPDWVPDFAGYLDLYSGKKGIASAVARSGKSWSITFELEDSEAQDLSLGSNRSVVEELIRLRAVHTVGAAIFCRFFSRAVRPPVRSKLKPFGLAQMSLNMKQKVDEGNDHALWLAGIIWLCREFSIRYWVENPDSSFLWLLDVWVLLGARNRTQCFRLDYCVCGCPWRKRTRFLTDLHLQGQQVFCKGGHKHVRLVGWSRLHRMPWTRVAQVYPRRLVHWVSSAILIDAGLMPGRRHLNLANICRCNHGRIGEASNPGPRRAARSRRPLQALLEADIVEPETALLSERIWWSFRNWACKSLLVETFDAVAGCPETLCLLIECFGKYLFEEGHSIYLLRQLITYVQRWKPQFRGSMRGAWQLVSRWEIIQPLRHRTPLPLVIYRAMVAIALCWKWYRWSAVTMLAFEGICRPGEPLSANRGDLLLPRDLLMEEADIVLSSDSTSKRPKAGNRCNSTFQDHRSTFSELPG